MTVCRAKTDPVVDALAVAIMDAACDSAERLGGISRVQVRKAFDAAMEALIDYLDLPVEGR